MPCLWCRPPVRSRSHALQKPQSLPTMNPITTHRIWVRHDNMGRHSKRCLCNYWTHHCHTYYPLPWKNAVQPIQLCTSHHCSPAYLPALTGKPRCYSKYSHATHYAGRHGGAIRVSCQSSAEVGGRTKASPVLCDGIADSRQWSCRHSDRLLQSVQASSPSAIPSLINTLRWCVRNDNCLAALNACQVAIQNLVDEWTVSSFLLIEDTSLMILRAEP
jgi:hypothetical protein